MQDKHLYPGSSSCFSCLAGTYLASGGACAKCSAGTWSGDGATACTNCISGTWSAWGLQDVQLARLEHHLLQVQAPAQIV